MNWLWFAFSGPVFWAASTHIDKYLVEKYFKRASTAVLMVFTALIGLLLLPFVWYWKPDVLMLPVESIAVMMASGVLYMAAMLFYLQALQTEEASVVAPLFQMSALFTYGLAFVFLHEALTGLQLGAGALILCGAFLLSSKSLRLRAFKSRLVFPMFLASLALALSSVIFKFFAVSDEFWKTVFWTYAGEAVFGFVLLAIPAYGKQFVALFKRHPGAMAGVNVANELINLGGSLGVRYAFVLAPVAIVQAISSTTLLFIFGFGIVLTLFFPRLGREDLSWTNLVQKGAAAVLIGLGVFFINR